MNPDRNEMIKCLQLGYCSREYIVFNKILREVIKQFNTQILSMTRLQNIFKWSGLLPSFMEIDIMFLGNIVKMN